MQLDGAPLAHVQLARTACRVGQTLHGRVALERPAAGGAPGACEAVRLSLQLEELAPV